MKEKLASEASAVSAASEWMTAREAAEYLRVCPWTVYRYARERVIPFYRLGRLVRFRRSDLDAWMDAGRVATAVEALKRLV